MIVKLRTYRIYCDDDTGEWKPIPQGIAFVRSDLIAVATGMLRPVEEKGDEEFNMIAVSFVQLYFSGDDGIEPMTIKSIDFEHTVMKLMNEHEQLKPGVFPSMEVR